MSEKDKTHGELQGAPATEGTEPDAAKLEQLAADAVADPSGEKPAARKLEPAPGNVTPIAEGRKRGRPKGSGKGKPATREPGAGLPAPIIPRETMRAVIQAPYALAANMYGPHWALSDEEAERMIDSHLAVAEMYVPATLAKYAPLYTVAFLHVMMISAKAQIHVKLLQEQRRKAEQDKPRTIETTAAAPPAGTETPLREVLRSRVRPGKEDPATK